MEKDPSRRVQTAAEVAERLEPWAAAATEIIEVPPGRQAWTPPPPPSDPSKIRDFEFADLPVAEAFSSGLSGEPLSVPQPPEDWEAGASRSRQIMPVAIALAVAIPISLLVGAVIGFLVRGAG